MLDYEIMLNFNPEKASKAEIDAFCKFASKYDALCLRKEENSRIYIISTEEDVDIDVTEVNTDITELNRDLNKKLVHVSIY